MELLTCSHGYGSFLVCDCRACCETVITISEIMWDWESWKEANLPVMEKSWNSVFKFLWEPWRSAEQRSGTIATSPIDAWRQTADHSSAGSEVQEQSSTWSRAHSSRLVDRFIIDRNMWPREITIRPIISRKRLSKCLGRDGQHSLWWCDDERIVEIWAKSILKYSSLNCHGLRGFARGRLLIAGLVLQFSDFRCNTVACWCDCGEYRGSRKVGEIRPDCDALT